MKTIWKWKLDPVSILEMPANAEILTVQLQFGEPQLWAVVETDNPSVKRKFITYGTGHTLPEEPRKYIGTFQIREGVFIFHVFEDLSYRT